MAVSAPEMMAGCVRTSDVVPASIAAFAGEQEPQGLESDNWFPTRTVLVAGLRLAYVRADRRPKKDEPICACLAEYRQLNDQADRYSTNGRIGRFNAAVYDRLLNFDNG